MLLNLTSVVGLLAVAAVWLITEQAPLLLEPHSLVVPLVLLSIGFFLAGIVNHKKAPAASKCLAVAAALSCATAARMGWVPEPVVSPYILWGVAFSMALVTGWLFRKAPSASPIVTSDAPSPQDSDPSSRMGLVAWAIFVAITGASALIFLFRLSDVPAEMNSYGTQALSAANRLIKGELLFKDLVLFREMTQEECGHSLPYVLWHALFQIASGGMSVFAGRLACATASWLSILFMFRVGRHLGGVPFGLAAMACYALMPLTMYDARSELILGFSALIMLLFLDAMLSYMRRPTLVRALWMGAAFVLTFYGLANIKMAVAAACIVFAISWLRSRALRSKSWQLLASAALVAILLLPQLAEWPKVSHQMKGRGEHLFGGVLPHLTLEDPRKPTQLRKALWILEENGQILLETTFGPYRETVTSLPGTLYAPLIVALGLAIGNLARTDRLFVTGVLLASYFGPAIAIPLGWVRLLMLGPGQALMLGSLWAEVYRLLATMKLRWGAAVVTIFIASSALSSVPRSLQQYLNQNSSLSLSRTFALQQPPGTIIFFTDRLETSGNVMRWNPPALGRDSLAERPVIVIREEGIPAIKEIVEQLNVPAIIMSNEPPPQSLFTTPDWSTQQEPGHMWVMQHTGDSSSHPALVKALDPRKLDSTSPVFLDRVYYQTYRLVLTPIHAQETISIDLPVAQPLEKAVIFARGRDSFTSPVDILLDSGGIQISTRSTQVNGKTTDWYETSSIPQGTHTLTLTLKADASEPVRYVDDVVVIGVAR